jgi:hypothetical protein
MLSFSHLEVHLSIGGWDFVAKSLSLKPSERPSRIGPASLCKHNFLAMTRLGDILIED